MDPVSCRTSECIPLFSGGVGDKYGKSIQRFLSLMALKICRAGCENGLPIHRKEEIILQEEIENRSVNLAVSTGKLSVRILLQPAFP